MLASQRPKKGVSQTAQDAYQKLGGVEVKSSVDLVKELEAFGTTRSAMKALEKQASDFISRTYEDGSYREILRAGREEIVRLEKALKPPVLAAGSDAPGGVSVQNESKIHEPNAELVDQLNKRKEARKEALDAYTEYKIANHKWEGGLFSSYMGRLGHAHAGRLSELGYTYFVFDLTRISAAVAAIQLLKIKDPSVTAINGVCGGLSAVSLIANWKGYSPTAMARAGIRQDLDDPTKSLWELMLKNKLNVLLTIFMLKHFIDGAYSDSIQLMDLPYIPLDTPAKLWVPSALFTYAGVWYYINYCGEDSLKGNESLTGTIGFDGQAPIYQFLKSLMKCEFRQAGCEFYVALMRAITVLQRDFSFAFSGFKEPLQAHFFIPGINKLFSEGTWKDIAYGSAAVSFVATHNAADQTRGAAIMQKYFDPGITAESYREAELQYNQRSIPRKMWDEVQRLCLSPSTFFNIPMVYLSAVSSIGPAIGWGLTAGALHACYRQAAAREDITTIATEIELLKRAAKDGAQAISKTEPNTWAKMAAFSLVACDMLTRVGANAVGFLTLIHGDVFDVFDIQKLKEAPQSSMEILLAIYCSGALIAAGNMPFMVLKVARGFAADNPGLFGRKTMTATAPQASLELDADAATDLEKGKGRSLTRGYQADSE